jgi:hypothetical protein
MSIHLYYLDHDSLHVSLYKLARKSAMQEKESQAKHKMGRDNWESNRVIRQRQREIG